MFGAELQGLCGIKDIPVILKRKDAESSSMTVQARSIVKTALLPLTSVQLQQFTALDL